MVPMKGVGTGRGVSAVFLIPLNGGDCKEIPPKMPIIVV